MPEITFAKWFYFGFPLSIFFVFIGWFTLYTIFLRGEKIKVDYNKIIQEKTNWVR